MSEFFWKTPYCRIMGILNVTPDSFSDGGSYLDQASAISRALQMQVEGAHMIDIGGESTRPGSEPVSEQEQLNRVIPVIKELKDQLSIPMSVDTTSAEVAHQALISGAVVINDVSAGLDDAKMIDVVVDHQCPVVLMHRRGLSKHMQEGVYYDNVVDEVIEFLLNRAQVFIDAGLDLSNICLDPGIGFGKYLQHNLDLIKNLSRLHKTGFPILFGASRKRFIGELLGISDPLLRDNASVTVAVQAAREGVSWVRVHAVKQTTEALKLNQTLGVC